MAVGRDRRRRTLVVLDRTVFYPGGGGQPSDRGLLLRAADGRDLDGPRGAQGRRRDRPRARARTTATRRPSATRVQVDLDWARRLRADADPHRAPRAVRRRLARLRRAGHRRQHGARLGADGLRVRDDVGRPRRRHRGDRQRRARRRARRAGRTSCRATRRSPSPTSSGPRSTCCPRASRRSGRSRSSGSTSRPTAAPTSPTPARSAASGSPATSRRAGSTSASGSSSSPGLTPSARRIVGGRRRWRRVERRGWPDLRSRGRGADARPARDPEVPIAGDARGARHRRRSTRRSSRRSPSLDLRATRATTRPWTSTTCHRVHRDAAELDQSHGVRRRPVPLLLPAGRRRAVRADARSGRCS